DAVVIRPDMAKYRKIGREVHAEMERLTPLVEPLSIDEAFLDLGGTEALHGACPAQLLIGLAARVETALGITVSIGLSDTKFLANAPAHTISAETTLAQDECDAGVLVHALWPLCERLSARLKQASLAAGTITLKLKTADFRLRTRSRRVADPTQLADTLYHVASDLLAAEVDGVTRFRLVGIGADHLSDGRTADSPTLFERQLDGPRRLEQ